jgi:hypothetical protein
MASREPWTASSSTRRDNPSKTASKPVANRRDRVMSRMSGPRRSKIYKFLCQRDGERCFIGTEAGNKETLVVDHWDNDNTHTDPSNLHLICRGMNAVKNPRRSYRGKMQSSVYVCENGNHELIEPPKTVSAEFLKNQIAEPIYLHWLFAEVVQHGRIPISDAIDCGAAIAHVSQVTVARYLKKATCKVGLFQLVEGGEIRDRFVELRPVWATFRKTEEERKKLEKYARNWRKEILDGIPGIAKGTKRKSDSRQEDREQKEVPNPTQPP